MKAWFHVDHKLPTQNFPFSSPVSVGLPSPTFTSSHLAYSALRLAACCQQSCSLWERTISKYSCCDFLPIRLDVTSGLDRMLCPPIRTFSVGRFAWLSNSLKGKPVGLPLTGSVPHSQTSHTPGSRESMEPQASGWCSVGIDVSSSLTLCPSSKYRKERWGVSGTNSTEK